VNFFRKIVHLCVGFGNYRDVLDVPFGAALGYLVRLLALLVVVLLVALAPWLWGEADAAAKWFEQKGPKFALHEGKVITEATQPFRARRDDFVFVLDTTGQTTEPDRAATVSLLLTSDSLLYRVQPTNTPAAMPSQRIGLGDLPNGNVDGTYVRQVLRWILWAGMPVGAVILLVGALLATLAQAWLFSFAANFLERGVEGALTHRQLLSLAIHAVTPAAIIVTAYAAFRLHGLDYGLIYLVAYGIFLIGASNACHQRATPEQSRDEGLF
jgi:hypothetical protein